MPKFNRPGVMQKSSSGEEEMPMVDPREDDHGIKLLRRK